MFCCTSLESWYYILQPLKYSSEIDVYIEGKYKISKYVNVMEAYEGEQWGKYKPIVPYSRGFLYSLCAQYCSFCQWKTPINIRSSLITAPYSKCLIRECSGVPIQRSPLPFQRTPAICYRDVDRESILSNRFLLCSMSTGLMCSHNLQNFKIKTNPVIELSEIESYLWDFPSIFSGL